MIKKEMALFCVSSVLALVACSVNVKSSDEGAVELLSDIEVAPVTNSMILMQESPEFPVDEKMKAFAVIADRDERVPTGNKPLSLEESKSRK